MKLRGGFTLLEVMVALAIAAVGLGAVSKAISQNVDVAAQLEERTLANWVASNRMAEIRMQRLYRAGGSQKGQVEMAGRSWVVEEEYNGTRDPNIARVTIRVFAAGSEGRPGAVDTGYIARYKPPVKTN